MITMNSWIDVRKPRSKKRLENFEIEYNKVTEQLVLRQVYRTKLIDVLAQAFGKSRRSRNMQQSRISQKHQPRKTKWAKRKPYETDCVN